MDGLLRIVLILVYPSKWNETIPVNRYSSTINSFSSSVTLGEKERKSARVHLRKAFERSSEDQRRIATSGSDVPLRLVLWSRCDLCYTSILLLLWLICSFRCTVEGTPSKMGKQTLRKMQRKLAHVHAVPRFSKRAMNGFNFGWIHFAPPATTAFARLEKENREERGLESRWTCSRLFRGRGRKRIIGILLHACFYYWFPISFLSVNFLRHGVIYDLHLYPMNSDSILLKLPAIGLKRAINQV